MDATGLILIFTFIANLGLGVYVLIKNLSNRVNQCFFLFILSVAVWTITTYFLWISKNYDSILFWGKMSFVGPALIPSLFICFILVFPKGRIVLTGWQKFILLGPGIFFAVISPATNFIVNSLPYASWANPAYGVLYPYFAAYFIVYLSFGFYLLIKRFARAEGREKIQLSYVLLGTLISAILGTALSLILPLLGRSLFDFYGPSATLIMVFLISYAIVKYRLLNLEDFLSRGIICIAVTAAVIGTFYLIAADNLLFIFPFYVIIANLSLGVFVLLQNVRSNINRTFAFMILCVVLWIIGVFQLSYTTRLPQMMFWSKFLFVGPLFLASSFLCFSFIFPKPLIVLSRFKIFLISIPPVLFLISLSGSLFLRGVVWSDGLIVHLYGRLFPLFIFYIIIYYSWAFMNLYSRYRQAIGLERMQIRYVFWGFFFSAIFGFTANLLLPFLQVVQFTTWGPVATIFMVVAVSYAIVKHRLMSIEILVQRGLIHTLVMIFVTLTYIVIVMGLSQYFGKLGTTHPIVPIIVAALVISFTVQPFLDFVQILTDRVFFRKRYDYQRTLGEVSREIASLIKIKQIAELVVKTLISTMQIQEISFLLLDRNRKNYKSVNLDDSGENFTGYQKVELHEENSIITWLRRYKLIAVLEEAEKKLEQYIENSQSRVELEELCAEIKKIGTDVCVPLFVKGTLVGVLTLGKKLSGDMYTGGDLQLLLALANQAAVGLENARLYEEMVGMKNYNEEVLQSMTNAVFTTDLYCRIITFNKMAERLTGISRTAAMGGRVDNIWKIQSTLPYVVSESLQGRVFKNLETTLIANAGAPVPVNINTVLLKEPNGKRTGVLVAITDLSEVKELEQRVRQSDKLAALGTMAAGMAHEIKNPLSSIKVLSQLMSKKFKDEEFRKKFKEIIPREIGRIDRIVESLLGFARASSPRLEDVSLKDLIEEVLALLSEQIENGKIKVKKEIGELPVIVGDGQQLTQIFMNLFLNAIQAMGEGGVLGILAKVGVSDEKTVCLEISDTGHGISKDYLTKLFDPFFTTKHGGTGLGLTIVHSIIEGHGGTISAESELGRGTTFKIILPVSQA